MEIRYTTPYSPSQNGIAEWMNRTLVELSCAMIIANDLPEFLREYMVLHATYLRNRSYTKHLPKITPYEGWHNKKLNVSHLHEFGAPVWILLQGQKVDRKMQPKSKHRVYVDFDDSAGAVKYYNTETRNVLTSRNFKQITPPQSTPIPENIDIIPNSQHKGESVGDAPPMGITGSDDITPTLEPSKKCKRDLIEDNIDINAP